MKMITAPILGLLAIVSLLPPSCMANQYRNSLKSGESLKASEALISGNYSFVMQPNCNLVLYHDSTAVWSTGTGGRDHSCSAKLLRGGNLVVYSPEGISLWESGGGRPERTEYILVLQKDGNAAIYGSNRWVLSWPYNDTVPDQWLVSPEPTNILYSGERLEADESLILGSYKCSMQTDCNFVCRNDTMLVWASKTDGKGSGTGCYFELGSRGMLAIYDSANSRLFGNYAVGPIGSYVVLMQKYPMLSSYGPQLWTTYWTSNATAQFSNRKIVTVMSQ